MKRSELYAKVIEWFQAEMPVAESELHYDNPYQLLVAVILSAQCTDKRINMVTPALFDRFPTPQHMAESTPEEVYEYIKSVSYPNNKAKNLVGMARKLVSDFGGVVPSDTEQLESLPGVGRKTANVVGVVIFNKAVMPVDTHVFRVSARIGLTVGARNPIQAEKQLEKYIDDTILPIAHHWLILHGRYICTARKPKCDKCGLTAYCKHYRKLRQAGNNTEEK